MNTIKNLDIVKNEMIEKSFVFWYIGSIDGKNIYSYNESENDPENSFDKLKSVLDSLTGVVLITLQKEVYEGKGGDRKNSLKFRYQCSSEAIQQQISTPMNQYNQSFPSVYELMNKNMELQLQLTRLELKLEFDNKGNSKDDLKEKMQIQMLNRIMNIFEGKTSDTKISQGEQPPPPKQADEKKDGEKVIAALKKMHNRDPQTVEVLTKLAKFAEENPELYEQAKMMLMAM